MSGSSEAPEAGRRRWQVKILLATWLAYAGYYFCRKAFYVVKGDMGRALALDSLHLAHIGTAYLVGYAIGQFSSAFFGTKLGPKLLLLAGMGISIACNVVFGIANGFWTLLLFMALNGMAQGTGWPGCIGSLSRWFARRQRGSILGVWSTCYQIGGVAATAYAAYILGLAGWRWSFFGASSALLAVWSVVLWLHPNTPEDVGLESVRDEEDGSVSVRRHADDGSWSRETVISVLLMGSIYFCIKFLRYALWSWVPYFLNLNFGLTGDQAGYLSTVFDLSGFAGVIVAGYLSDRLFKGRRSMVSLAMLGVMTLSFFGLYWFGSRNTLFFAVALGLCGFMLYGPDSLLSGVGAIDVGSVGGSLAAAGIINGMGSVGPIFQEQIIGWMYEAYGRRLMPIFLMLVAVAAIGTLLMLALHLRARRGLSNV